MFLSTEIFPYITNLTSLLSSRWTPFFSFSRDANSGPSQVFNTAIMGQNLNDLLMAFGVAMAYLLL